MLINQLISSKHLPNHRQQRRRCHTLPSPSSPPDPLPSEADKAEVARNDVPALEEEPEVEVKDVKAPPLTKAQQKKKKQQEAKEAKEKADREFQEQLEKELAEEANPTGDNWNDSAGGDAGNTAGAENVGLDGTKDTKNGDDTQDGELKKDEEKDDEKKEEEDFGLPVKNKKGKKKKGK